MRQRELLDALISVHFLLGLQEQAFFFQFSVMSHHAEGKDETLIRGHTPVIRDPETGSLSSNPFMAITLTWYSTPGVSFTRRVSVSVPSTVTMDGVPGD